MAILNYTLPVTSGVADKTSHEDAINNALAATGAGDWAGVIMQIAGDRFQFDTAAGTMLIPFDTIFVYANDEYAVPADTTVDLLATSQSSAKKVWWNRDTNDFLVTNWNDTLSSDLLQRCCLIATMRFPSAASPGAVANVSCVAPFEVDGTPYGIENLDYSASMIMVVPGLSNQGMPDFDMNNQQVKIYDDTIFRHGNEVKIFDGDVTIDISGTGSTANVIWYSFESDDFIVRTWGTQLSAAQRREYRPFAFVRNIGDGTLHNGSYVSMSGPYRMNGVPFGLNEVPSSQIQVINGIYNRAFPNIDRAANTLTFYADTIFKMGDREVILENDPTGVATRVIDLSVATSSARAVWYSFDSDAFLVTNWNTLLNDADRKEYNLVCMIRFVSSSDSETYCTLSGPYTVGGKLFGVEQGITDRVGYIGIIKSLYAPVPAFDTETRTLTLYNDTMLVYRGEITYRIPEDVVINLDDAVSSAKKIYFNFDTQEFTVTNWNGYPPSGDDLLFCTLRFPAPNSPNAIPSIAMIGEFTVDGKMLGLSTGSGTVGSTQLDTLRGIAHRGYSGFAPENTIPAYKAAAQAGFSYCECDIRWTSDDVPVLMHDDTIDRTSDGTGQISQLTLAQAKTYDYGSWFSSAFVGTEIPTLEEFLIACKKLNLIPWLELKVVPTAARAQQVKDLVYRTGMNKRVIYTSFSKAAIDAMQLVDPDATVALISSDLATQQSLRLGNNDVIVYLYWGDMAANAQKFLDDGFDLAAWTVNTVAIATDMLDLGVTYIGTDVLNVKDVGFDDV